MARADNLYFIRIIQDALKRADKGQELLSAFEEIKIKGKSSEYKQGYKNFQDFMKIIDAHIALNPDYLDEIKFEIFESRLIDLATYTFEGSDHDKQRIFEFIKHNPELYSEYERIRGELELFLPEIGAIQIEIEKDGELLGTFEFDKESNTVLINGVMPGAYSLKLTTGRLLWEGRLMEEGLIWAKAFPKENIPAAAKTAPIGSKPTLTKQLLEGEIKLDVYPWLGSGIILLTLRHRK